jgi:hypothetical protein
MVLIYGGNKKELSIKGYVDASFDTDLDDSNSQTGYVFMLNGGAVSSESCKQDLVAQSTMELEYTSHQPTRLRGLATFKKKYLEMKLNRLIVLSRLMNQWV